MHVARLAGVSRATASAALNGKGKFTDQTRKAVMDAARALGYRPNPIGRTLRVGSPPLVGLVIDRALPPENAMASQHFFSRILLKMCNEFSDRGYGLVVLSLETHTQLREFPFDALFVLSSSPDFRVPDSIGHYVPVLAAGRRRYDDRIASLIYHDQAAMTAQVLDHLSQAGASRIALVPRVDEQLYVAEVIAAYESWCCEHDQEVTLVKNDGTVEGIRSSVAEAVEQGVDAFYTVTGECYSTLHGIGDAGRAVPDDVLVVSMHESIAGATAIPTVTTMSMCADESSVVVVQALVELATGESGRTWELPYRLTVRESSSR